jgi:hypothetical protein
MGISQRCRVDGRVPDRRAVGNGLIFGDHPHRTRVPPTNADARQHEDDLSLPASSHKLRVRSASNAAETIDDRWQRNKRRRNDVRILFALPLLIVAACNVENDKANDQVTLEYNEQRIEEAAKDTADAAKEVASGVGNVAASTAGAIKNEVGDIDVDVDVSRNRNEQAKN